VATGLDAMTFDALLDLGLLAAGVLTLNLVGLAIGASVAALWAGRRG
jgi:hypothetical protein